MVSPTVGSTVAIMANMTDAISTAPEMVHLGLKLTHYAFPALCFFYFVLALTITVCTLQTQSLRVKDQHVRRNVMISLLLAATGTYIAQAVTIFVKRVLKEKPDLGWNADSGTDTDSTMPDDLVVYVLGSILVFGVQVLALTEAKFPVWYPYYATWFLAIVVELALLIVPNVFDHPELTFDFVFIAIQAVRIVLFIILISLYFGLRNDKKQYDNADAECQSLLRKKLAPKQGSGGSATNGNGYGATTTTTTTAENGNQSETASDAGSEDSWLAERRKAQEKVAERLRQDGNWFTYAKGFAIFFPYIWPVHDKALQFRAVLVGLCLLASNALNVLVPNQLGVMIDALKARVGEKDTERAVFLPVIIYAALLFTNGGACIGWLRKWLWMPVEQYSYDALSTASHAHLMSLSSDFHDSKTSSDLTQAVHGGRSVSDLLETVCFQVIPMFIDLAVAFAYLWTLFGPYMGFIMAVTVISYLYITTKLVAVRAEKRRDYVTVYRKEWTVGQQSLDGWSTASLFNMIPYERHRYACAVKEHMKVKRSYELSSQAIGAAQGLVMTFGLLGALFLGVYQVVYEDKSIGKFTTLLVYWAQLQSPLVFFSNMYRSISYSLMDAERLLELFQTKPTVFDRPNAKTLKFGKGEVKFNRVSFAYDERKPTLKDVTFTVPAGKTVAIVGETGGGKTTILKLIHRFYDVKGGSISIDGHDLRDVTLDSLRDKIGVVPQDPMLFNDSIMNNVRYARISASDKEVYEACKAAAIHDKIMSFPDGYNSKVGDRGVKLSGGEKQRVAIARAMLKKPEIILLDEATSAVDTDTEHMIQEGFKTLCKNRTTFIVAHRLSTIMRADRILVVMNGEIVEEGTHDELIHAKGKYLHLWSKQVYVKPADGRARSQSPKKRDAEIINDLTPSCQKTELAKVMQTTAHEEPTSYEESTEESAKECSKEPPKEPLKESSQASAKAPPKGATKLSAKQPVKEPANEPTKSAEASGNGRATAIGGHKRESSKLKPDAPEFIPSMPKANDRAPSKTDAKNAAKEQKKLEKLEKEQQKQQRKAGSSVGKKPGKGLGRHDGADDIMDSTADKSHSAEPSSEQLAEGYISGIDKAKPKYRSGRRQMAKSEPASRLEESFDGTQDSDITAVSSGEGQPLLQQRRRVSAPSDPPSGPSSSRVGPRRRRRNWRLRNRAGDNSGSGSASGTTTSDESAVPPPPVGTPAEDAQPTTTTIRFAPGS